MADNIFQERQRERKKERKKERNLVEYCALSMAILTLNRRFEYIQTHRLSPAIVAVAVAAAVVVVVDVVWCCCCCIVAALLDGRWIRCDIIIHIGATYANLMGDPGADFLVDFQVGILIFLTLI